MSHFQILGKMKTSLDLLHICLFINFWLSGIPPLKDSNQVHTNPILNTLFFSNVILKELVLAKINSKYLYVGT